jgi:mannose-6-phosphate isomerase-like protein (cupin superfamily)
MIRKKGEGTLTKRVIGETGVGEVELLHKFSLEDMYDKARLCAEITLAPGQVLGEHAHGPDFEIFYMLSGAMVSFGEGKAEEPFLPGDIMLTGGGDKHALRNDGDVPATMLAIVVL